MCSSNCAARDARRARAAHDRDDRAARRAVLKKRLVSGALPLPGGFEKVHPVTELSNLQMIIYREAKRNGSKQHSNMLNVSSNSCRKLTF